MPPATKTILAIALCAQIAWQALAPAPVARASALTWPPETASLRLVSLGEPIALAHALALYLQAFDNQPGISIPYRELDYLAVEAWLTAALMLDPHGHYPLMMAAHLYSLVPDEAKQRRMLGFVHRAFLRDPDGRWRWLAHAAIVAKHRLKDMPLALRYAARSDVGLIRAINEDSGYAGPRLLVIADGVGGHAAGEVASSVAVAQVSALDEDSPGGDLLERLSAAVNGANNHLRDMVVGDPELEGMGTTLTALLRAGSRFGLVHVGDSRCYLLRNGELHQITRDHTFVQTLVDEGRITAEEADHHPQRNVITNSLDGREDIDLDLSVRETKAGDRYLLCSDGLSGVVSHTEPHQAPAAPIAIARAAAPDGPYSSVRIGIAPVDPDGVALAALDLDADNSGSNERGQVGAVTAVRFGRLRLENAVGSQNLDLPIPIQLEYWNGQSFVVNTADTCTTISAANLAFSSYQGGIDNTNMNAGNLAPATIVFSGPNPGVGSLTLTKPLPAPASPGAVTLTVNLAAEAKSYLKGNWGVPAYTEDPRSRAAFGLYAGQPGSFIYFRENY